MNNKETWKDSFLKPFLTWIAIVAAAAIIALCVGLTL